MKIAQISPLYEAVPPRLYGGTERVVAHLCDALVELGHEVTLFAAADARHPRTAGGGARSGDPPRPLAAQIRPGRAPDDAVRSARAAHASSTSCTFTSTCCISRCSSRRRAPQRDHAARAARHEGSARGLSRAGRASAWYRSPTSSVRRCRTPTGCRRCRTAWPPSRYPFSPRAAGGYLAFLGRISPEKGPDIAMRVAMRAGSAAEDRRQGGRASIVPTSSASMQPLLDHPLIEFIGEIGDERQGGSFSATPRRCCSRSTGRSPSAWS